jgi:hypothetical protein
VYLTLRLLALPVLNTVHNKTISEIILETEAFSISPTVSSTMRRTPGMEGRSIARTSLRIPGKQQTQKMGRHTSVHLMVFEPTVPVFERSKAVPTI